MHARHTALRTAAVAFAILLTLQRSGAQELEPRFLSPSPVGINFLLLGYTNSDGNVLLDPALPLEDTNARMDALALGYARSIDVFGASGRVYALLPLGTATWSGSALGTDTSTTRDGLADPVIGMSVNFIGSPALRGKEFFAHEYSTILGFSAQVRPPLGQYYEERFFNIGSNRWTFVSRLGLSQKLSDFTVEGYANAWFFTANNEFYNGNTIEQEPLFIFELHGSYTFMPGLWAALSFGQSYGGASELNGEEKNSAQKNNRWGATLSVPLSRIFSVKASYMSGITTRYGANLRTVAVFLQYRWGGM